MKNLMRIGVYALVACLLPCAAVASSDEPQLSVGDFAVRLAAMITQRSAVEPAEAVAYLGELGVKLEGTLDAPVTEQMIVEAFGDLGLRVASSSPADTVSMDGAERLFQMFDRNDSMFSGEIFRLCKGGGDAQNTPCFTDTECNGGFCQDLPSVKCQSGPNEGQACMSNADCPMGLCNIPPGQAKKLNLASPDD